MADNPTPNPNPISRDEFDDFKRQMLEMTAMMRDSLLMRQNAPPKDQLNKDDQVPPKEQDPPKTDKAPPKKDQIPPEDEQIPPKVGQTSTQKVINVPEDDNNEDLRRKMKKMEEAIQLMKGIGSLGRVNYADLCVFPGARYPEKFKIPEFEKYNGTGDPYTHLKIYIGELGSYAEDESLRMQLFQKSLTGEARTWYARLDNTRIHDWEELAHTFLNQYSFQAQMAPDRCQMTKIKKYPQESFRDYAQRWRNMAAQVNPPMSEAEMVMTFVDIQDAPYYERVISGIGRPFAEMIKHGEMVDIGIKAGKIRDFTALETAVEQIQRGNYGSTSHRTQKKEEDVSLILHGPSRRVESSPTVQRQRNFTTRQPNFNNQRQDGRRRFEKNGDREFTPLGDSLEQILSVLVAQKKITELAPPTDPKGRSFDPTKKCAYHSGSPGHDTQECWSLKHKIQNMIDHGEIVVEQLDSPNVKVNPLPKHNTGGVHVIEATESGGPPRLNYIRRVDGMIGITQVQENVRGEPDH